MEEQTVGATRSRSRVTQRAAWSPAQIIAGLGGLLYIVIGAIALARTGTDFSNIAATHASVIGLHYTCLSAVVQLGVGILLLVGVVGPGAAKATTGLFGLLSVVWGIIIVVDVPRLFLSWGYTKGTGVFYIVVGAILLLGGVVSPVIYSRQREVVSGSGQYVDTAPR